ncbi:MAG: magnesium transporter [Chloroflexi bacterium]|nr:magnesium transporter [Chloroflexota bacterium]
MTQDSTAADDRADRDDADELASLLGGEDSAPALAYARALHPAELAVALAGLDTGLRVELLRLLEPAEIAAALGFMEAHFRSGLLTPLDPPTIARVIDDVPDNVATDLVQSLPADVSAAVLLMCSPRVRRAIGDLASYPADTAGGRMTGQRVAVRPERTVVDVIAFLRSLRPDTRHPFYLYLTDEGERLLGVLNLRDLLTAAPETPVSQLAGAQATLISVQPDTDQEEAARLLKQYNLLALPVIDAESRLLGTVTHDDLLDVLEDEATEDMFRIVGVDEEEDLRSVRRSVRYRLPWLTVNMLTVLAAGFVVSLYEDTLTRVAVLAAFLPVVAGQGGNAGIQTLTVVVRSLALGRLTARSTLRVVAHELLTGLVMGVAIGLAVAVLAALWQGNPVLGVVVGVALAANMVVGVLAGVLIPMGLSRLQQDPALSAGIWLTTATDLLGFVVYLSLAALLISKLE